MERIGGSIEVITDPGVGTTFRIKIPLTLAIIGAIIVRCGGQQFAVPQAGALEIIQLDPREPDCIVEYVGGAPVYRLRGALLPLVYLRDVLGLQDQANDTAHGVQHILVAGSEDRQYGLVVDEVLDTEEVAVKPLSAQLKRTAMYAGATILGDGRVSLILDVWAIAHRQRVEGSAGRSTTSVADVVRPSAGGIYAHSHLVVRLADERRIAIPLSAVTRLEEIPSASLEQVGPREHLQYDGNVLPIARLSRVVGALDSGESADERLLQVVVYTANGRSIGLVVDAIIDIDDEPAASLTDIDGPGVSGTAIVQQRITEILDVQQAILAADPHFFDEPVSMGAGA
jgi:two-component system chemotaxis sensor kinase CheA